MDRTIWTVAMCYLLGLVLGNGLFYFPIIFTLMGLAGLLFLLRLFRSTGMNGPLIVAGIVFALFGIWQIQSGLEAKNPVGLSPFVDSGYVWIHGLVVRPVQRGPEKSVAVIHVDRVETQAGNIKIDARVRLSLWSVGENIQYRDQVRARVKLRKPIGLQNHWGFDYGAYLSRDGIHALASIRKKEYLEVSPGRDPSLLGPVYRVREAIRKILVNSLSEEPSAILQAMLIGETRGLTHNIREPFMISGTVHLLSISGSHLAMVGWLAFQGSRAFLKRLPQGWILLLSRRIALVRISVLVTVFPVVGYTLLSGSQVETVRALVMVLVYLLAWWFQRDHHSFNALALSALLILFFNPSAIFSVSFQLSYITVFTLIIFYQFLNKGEDVPPEQDNTRVEVRLSPGGTARKWGIKLGRKLREAVTLSAVAGIVTFPLTAYYFNQIAWMGFIANIVAVPFVGFIMVPLGLICSLFSVLFDFDTLWMSGLNEFLAAQLLSFARLMSDVPMSEVHVPAPPLIVVAAIYGIAALAVLAHGWFRPKIIFTIGLAGIVFIWVFRMIAGPPLGYLQVVFFDVGQGDGAWVRLPDGKTMIIDGGKAYKNFDIGRMVIGPFLWNLGLYDVDILVATHPQLDHVGGHEFIINKFRVGEVWTNGMDKDADFYRRFRSAMAQNGLIERPVSEADGAVIKGKNYEVRILNPGNMIGGKESTLKRKSSRENDQSIVLRIQYGNEVLLFTGDIEKKAELRLLKKGFRLRSTVLKVPHHGSRSSIVPDFIERVKPEVAVFSAGRNNPYRHPSVDTLKAYRKIRSEIFRTDRQGAIVYVSDGENRVIRTSLEFKVTRVGLDGNFFRSEMVNISRVLSHYWYGPLGNPLSGESGLTTRKSGRDPGG